MSAIRGLERVRLMGQMPGRVLACPKCAGRGTRSGDPSAGGAGECPMCRGKGRIVTR
jgi:DnaJ-class molecular chaperone